jgi:hypothetical protein
LGVDSTSVNLEELSVMTVDSSPYHSVLLEKPQTQSWRKDEIIASLQEKGIPFAQGSFKAELLNLAMPTHPQERGETISFIIVSPLNKLLLVYRLGVSSPSFSTIPCRCSCT